VLNKDNADTLNKQLQQEQHTSIQDLNELKIDEPLTVKRYQRLRQVNLPAIDFYQLTIKYQTTNIETDANTQEKLSTLLSNLETYKTTALTYTSTLDSLDQHDNIKIIDSTGNDIAHYSQWLFQIARASFSNLTVQKLRAFNDSLTAIFQRITDQKDQHRTFNTLYDLVKIESQIRLSFAVKRNYETHYDHVKESAQLLKITTVPDVFNDDKLYPSEDNTAQILQSDQNNAALDESQIKRDYERVSSLGLANTPTFENYKNSLGMTEVSFDVKHKNHSFHYLPYHFDSGFERDVFKDALGLDSVHAKNLEIYYNGERGLTSFVVNCATQQGKNLENLGKYTPDFLIIQRDVEQQIHKMLIIETKGNHLGHKFKDRRTFMENDFLEENEKQFGYARFDFLYLEDSNSRYLVDLNTRINQFFNE
jgi:uncharacterized protein YnzC (UPF0291/DUF896 family)